jgi:hypothetical protein
VCHDASCVGVEARAKVEVPTLRLWRRT